jgi:hypothetical protein
MCGNEEDKEINIASGNKVASDNTAKISLFNIENDFSGLKDAIALFFPAYRYEMILRYRAETVAKIGLEAYKLAQNENIKIKPIPPKIALPIIEKMSLEHEEDMYEKWAKLLIAAGVNSDPIHQQYAEVLANLNKQSAELLKDIYIKQKNPNLQNQYDEYADKKSFAILKNKSKNTLTMSINMNFYDFLDILTNCRLHTNFPLSLLFILGL